MASKSHKTESIALRISLYVLWFSQKNSKHTTLAHAKTPQRSPKKQYPWTRPRSLDLNLLMNTNHYHLLFSTKLFVSVISDRALASVKYVMDEAI